MNNLIENIKINKLFNNNKLTETQNQNQMGQNLQIQDQKKSSFFEGDNQEVLDAIYEFNQLFKKQQLINETGYTLNASYIQGTKSLKNTFNSLFKSQKEIQIIMNIEGIQFICDVKLKQLLRILEVGQFLDLSIQDLKNCQKKIQQSISKSNQNNLNEDSQFILVKKTSVISNKTQTSKGESNSTCCICLFNQVSLVFPCCHSYCEACSNQWMQEKGQKNCPMCRKDFTNYENINEFQKDIFHLQEQQSNYDNIQQFKQELLDLLRDYNQQIPKEIQANEQQQMVQTQIIDQNQYQLYQSQKKVVITKKDDSDSEESKNQNCEDNENEQGKYYQQQQQQQSPTDKQQQQDSNIKKSNYFFFEEGQTDIQESNTNQ